MAQEHILLDTSVWVGYFRRGGSEQLKAAVQKQLALGRVATCWAVNTEILVGARDEPAFETLLEALRGLPEVVITGEVWEAAARLGHRLRRRGLLLPLPDLLIAECAMVSDRILWHADEHFEQVRQHTPLVTRYWKASD